MEYRREIDGLRALAVLPVILFHAGFQTFSGGFVGVDVFFVISGYLITSIILAELEQGKFSIINFYERRARRILPALFLVMFACLPFAWLWLLPSDMRSFSQSVMAVSTFLSNILFWRWSGYFDGASELKPLLHTWSLAVEEQYYVLFPIFLIGVWRLGKRAMIFAVVLIALFSLLLGELFSIQRPFFAFFLLPTRGWELLLGALLSLFCFTGKRFEVRLSLNQGFSIFGLILVVSSVLFFDKSTPSPGFYTLAPTLGSALIIFSATKQTIVGKLLGSKLFVGIGLISYSAYLWHQPVFSFWRHRSTETPSQFVFIVLSFVVFTLAFFTWKFVEVPFRNREVFSRKQIFGSALLFTSIFFVLGYWGFVTNGFSERFSITDRDLAELNIVESGRYVDKLFIENVDRPFDSSQGRKKILIVGDSYAKDFVNVIYESNYRDNFQISTHYISAGCGNLFLERDFKKFIGESDRLGCSRAGWYESKALQRQLFEADEIWLVSSWSYWVAERLPESINNLRLRFGKKVLVFGTKDFGRISIKSILSVPFPQRIELRNLVNEDKRRTNLFMKSTIPIDIFVNLMDLACDKDGLCQIFNGDGKLLSYDGSHLTKDGAKFFGQRLEGYFSNLK